MTEIYNKLGIRQLCEQKINAYFDEARAWLDRISLPEEKKAEMRSFTDSMLHREN